MQEISYKRCTGTKHQQPSVNSPHPKDKVPLELFMKDVNNPKSKIFSTCIHCRECKKLQNNKSIQKEQSKISMQRFLVLNGESDLMHCASSLHGVSGSKYSKNQVPFVLFLNDPEDIRSELFSNCLDCRIYKQKYTKSYIQICRKEAEEKGDFYCVTCSLQKPSDQKGKNLNGTDSAVCKSCKIFEKKRNYQQQEKFSQILENLKLEFIQKHECSCYKCKAVYFKPSSEDSLITRRFDTRIVNGRRCILYEGVECPVSLIVTDAKEMFELTIIEFDHLPEIDQRERGLLLQEEIYVPKSGLVGQMSTEKNMRLEAKKCQHLCSKCHVEETIKREKGNSPKSTLLELKADYVNKIKSAGCSSCQYTNINLLRFFDMDHLHPESKITDICIMTRDPEYTFEMLADECKKCRVLCKFCHAIHSKKQRNQKRKEKNANSLSNETQ